MLCSLCNSFGTKAVLFPEIHICILFPPEIHIFSDVNKLTANMCWAIFLTLNLHEHKSFDLHINKIRIRPTWFIISLASMICFLGCTMSPGESEDKTESNKFYGTVDEFILNILNQQFPYCTAAFN